MSAKAFVAEQHCFSPSLLHVSTYYVTPLVLSFSTIDNSFWSVGVCYKRAASCICFLPFPDADVRSINWYLNHFSGGEDRGQSSTRLLHFVISRSHDALIRFESGGLCLVSPGWRFSPPPPWRPPRPSVADCRVASDPLLGDVAPSTGETSPESPSRTFPFINIASYTNFDSRALNLLRDRWYGEDYLIFIVSGGKGTYIDSFLGMGNCLHSLVHG